MTAKQVVKKFSAFPTVWILELQIRNFGPVDKYIILDGLIPLRHHWN